MDARTGSGPPPLFPQFINDATLKLLDLREVDQPQHIHFQRRQLRGWPHRRSVHRQIRDRFQLVRLEHHLTLHPKNPLRQVRPTRARAIERSNGDHPDASLTYGHTAISLPSLRLLGNDAIELALEPGGIGECEVDAHSPITAARSEHEVKGSTIAGPTMREAVPTFKTVPSRLLTQVTIEPGRSNCSSFSGNSRGNN